MKNILKGFALSVSMLTTIPFFKVHDFNKGINGHAVMFYPLVGLMLGWILLLLFSALSAYVSSTHLGVIIFGLLVLLTGALHIDGFSDTVDGMYVPKERALKVMKDPNIGGMGMIITATFLILKASSISLFLTDYEELLYLLPVTLMLSRLNALLAIYFFPYISQNGIAALAKEEFKKSQLIFALIYTAVILSVLNAFALLIASLLLLFVIKYFFIKRYGGFSGDIYGFTIEVTELVLINIIIFGLLS